MEVQRGNVSLQVGNIWYCPQIPTLWMQCVSLNTLLSYVSESRFCPKDASSMKDSEETAVLLLFISNASYTDIEYIHIRLVMIRRGYKVGDQSSIVPYVSFIQNQLVETCARAQTRRSSLPQPRSFCLFAEDYESMMAPLTEPPYCLVYPIRFFNDTSEDLKNQLHVDLFPPGLHCWECVCCQLIHWANLHEKWETIMGGSRLLLPLGAQYDDNPLLWLIRLQNHRSLLVDPVMAHPYPMVEVGSFMMQDPLFPGTAGDSYIYWGDAQKWLEERGYRVLKYTGPGPEVPLAISASTIVLTSGTNDAILQGGMPEPNSTLPPAATTNGTITANVMPAPQGGVCHQHQVSKSPSCKIKKAWLDDSNSSGATLSLIGDGSASFGSLAPTPFGMPQFTSTPGKTTTEARVCSLSRDSDSLAGPHGQMEVFPTDFGQSLPPTTPVPSVSGSQLVGSSMYAPPFPPIIGTGGATLNSIQAEELYMLASECRLLSIGLACGFCQLSGEEAASRLQALATTQEILCKPQGNASNTWKESHMPLLAHVMKFYAKLGMYLGDANKDMMDKAKEIWMCIQAVAMALDMAPDAHIRLTLFLLD